MLPHLISFFVLAYNQEKFIHEAVEAAFAQTYSPLEIILSDDCSADRTFEIIQEMAVAYKGPHKVIVNRNNRNLGITGHLNRGVQLSSGEWIVCAAGDDISMNERCAEIANAFISNPGAHSVHSLMNTIDEWQSEIKITGSAFTFSKNASWVEDLCEVVRHRRFLMGATHAFSRLCFTKFGPISESVINEDSILMMRSCLLGGVAFIDKPLVRYRKHENNITGYNLPIIHRMVRYAQFSLAASQEWKKEIEKIDWIDTNAKTKLGIVIGCRILQDRMTIEILEAKHPYVISIKWLLKPDSNRRQVLHLVRELLKAKFPASVGIAKIFLNS